MEIKIDFFVSFFKEERKILHKYRIRSKAFVYHGKNYHKKAQFINDVKAFFGVKKNSSLESFSLMFSKLFTSQKFVFRLQIND